MPAARQWLWLEPSAGFAIASMPQMLEFRSIRGIAGRSRRHRGYDKWSRAAPGGVIAVTAAHDSSRRGGFIRHLARGTAHRFRSGEMASIGDFPSTAHAATTVFRVLLTLILPTRPSAEKSRIPLAPSCIASALAVAERCHERKGLYSKFETPSHVSRGIAGGRA